MAPLLELCEITKIFGSRTALRDISLAIEPGEVVFIVGPSGSGKSTLLRCCNLLERPTSGRVIFQGADVTAARRVNEIRQSIGIVFQSFNLYPHMTAYWNVAVALRLVLRLASTETNRRTMHFLEKVGLADRACAYPSELSGGQQQRVAIARALALQPRLMLFDEPTSALDPELVGSVLGVMREMRAEGMTMMIASHEMQFAKEAADRVLVLDGGQLIEEGSPDQIFGNAREIRTRAFLSRVVRS
jgi:polar amino acid transport system ATP-binding protein